MTHLRVDRTIDCRTRWTQRIDRSLTGSDDLQHGKANQSNHREHDLRTNPVSGGNRIHRATALNDQNLSLRARHLSGAVRSSVLGGTHVH